MTREEIISDLEVLKQYFESQSKAYPICLQSAIEVLQAEPRSVSRWIDEDDYDPNPVLLHIETYNLDYDVNEENVSWHWKRLNTYRSATYEGLIKAWEREKGYRV